MTPPSTLCPIHAYPPLPTSSLWGHGRYFRITRDIAHKLVPPQHPLKGKPSLVHSKFFPPLEGALGKMSSSNDSSAVFLTDPPGAIKEKIKTHAFSGGQETRALQEEKGADLEADVAYQWLYFFLEDDHELQAIGERARASSFPREALTSRVRVCPLCSRFDVGRKTWIVDTMLASFF